MDRSETAPCVRFESTIWDVVYSARDSKPALERLIRIYEPVIVRFAQRCGLREPEAEDIAQEVFLRICRGDVLERVDRAKGKFRTFLLVMAKNLIVSDIRRRNAAKRGSGAPTVSLDSMKEEAEFEAPGGTDPEEVFNRIWADNLIRLALAQMRAESETKDNIYFKALTLHLSGLSRDELARRLRRNANDVKFLVHYGLSKLRQHVRALIADYAVGSEERSDELRLLSQQAC